MLIRLIESWKKHDISCELTKHVWQLRDSGKAFSVRGKLLEHVKGRLIGGECRLCVTEKLHIIEHPNYRDGLLNSNSDMICVHGWKHRYLDLVDLYKLLTIN